MCKHKPITLYEHGGQTIVCAYCGMILKPWNRNGERGQIGAVGVAALVVILVSFAVWAGVLSLTRCQCAADIAGGAVFLLLFFFVLDRTCRCAKAQDDEPEVQ